MFMPEPSLRQKSGIRIPRVTSPVRRSRSRC